MDVYTVSFIVQKVFTSKVQKNFLIIFFALFFRAKKKGCLFTKMRRTFLKLSSIWLNS